MTHIDVWQTVFAGYFDTNKYLYHYTNIDKAIKIINSNNLRFSPITNTNDTSEAKRKIMFSENNILNKEEYDKKIKKN